VQVGDAIMVFPGANMPFVSRQMGRGFTYRIVRPAYVRGLMQGQVFDLVDSGGAEEREFRIS
jgi:hypothetical protein